MNLMFLTGLSQNCGIIGNIALFSMCLPGIRLSVISERIACTQTWTGMTPCSDAWSGASRRYGASRYHGPCRRSDRALDTRRCACRDGRFQIGRTIVVAQFPLSKLHLAGVGFFLRRMPPRLRFCILILVLLFPRENRKRSSDKNDQNDHKRGEAIESQISEISREPSLLPLPPPRSSPRIVFAQSSSTSCSRPAYRCGRCTWRSPSRCKEPARRRWW